MPPTNSNTTEQQQQSPMDEAAPTPTNVSKTTETEVKIDSEMEAASDASTMKTTISSLNSVKTASIGPISISVHKLVQRPFNLVITNSSECSKIQPLDAVKLKMSRSVDGRNATATTQNSRAALKNLNNDENCKSTLTKRQFATLAMMALANFSSTVTFSCVVPFFPGEAHLKGLDPSKTGQIGLIIGVFQLIMLITAPIIGRYMTVFGPKKVFVTGLFVAGLSSIAFGALKFSPNYAFFATALFIRCVQAFGNACFITTSMAICASYFSERVSRVMGVLGAFNGLGYTTGPLIGSGLYEIGGFLLPFLVLGALMLSTGVLSCFLLKETNVNSSNATSYENETAKAMSPLIIIRLPFIWLAIVGVILYTVSVSFFDASLADHVATFNDHSLSSSVMVAVVLAFLSITYVLTSPLWGYLNDRFRCYPSLVLFGALIGAVATLLMGPSPILGLPRSCLLLAISFPLLGVSESVLYLSTFQMCMDIVRRNGLGGSVKTCGCVSGVFNSAAAFGSFIGAVCGGIGVQEIGFASTATLVSGLHLLFICAFLFYLLERSFSKKRNRSLNIGHFGFKK